MRRALFALLLLVYVLFPIPLFGESGLYNTITRISWCEDENSCLHEIGHALDQHAGWVSHSDEFINAVQIYIMLQDELPGSNLLARRILLLAFERENIFRDEQSELYANIFAWSDGKQELMPLNLRPYYDWQEADRLIEKASLQSATFPLFLSTIKNPP